VPAGPDGGAVWGEVEDLPLKGGSPPTKVATPTTVIPGEKIHYKITLHGNPNLSGVLSAGAASAGAAIGNIEYPLPDLVEFAGGLTCSSPGCTYDADSNTVRWGGELMAESVVTVEFDVLVPESWPITRPPVINRATVFDGILTYDLQTTTYVQCVPTKRVSQPVVVPGQSFSYTMALPLHPEMTAPTEVALTDPLPSELQFRGDLVAMGGTCSYNDGTHTISCAGTLEPGQQLVASFTVAVRQDLPPSACPPTIVNAAQMFDGLMAQAVDVSVAVLCEG
jgi:hypothetical protein